MLAIKNNIMASNAARHLTHAYAGLSSSVERLASGLRINGARDDAAGLAVRELIRADIAVLRQGSRNAQDGISMLQTMEGAMQVIDDNLIRMQELAEQAATGSYSPEQRTIMNAEFTEMADEIERIAGATKFNGITMLNTSTGTVSIHVGTQMTVDVDKVNMTKSGLGIETGNGNWSIMTSDDNAYDDINTTTVLKVAAGATSDFEVNLTFTDADGTNEQTISVTLATAGTESTYTLQELADAINAASNNPSTMYDASGNSFGYSAASIQETGDGDYKLKLEALGSAMDGMTMTNTGALSAGAVVGIFAGDDGAWGAAGDMLAAGDAIFQKWDAATTDWITDSAGGAGAGLNILTTTAAAQAIDTIKVAINTKDSARASFGYKMNHLEKTIAILDIQQENLQAAESRISDVDVATEMAILTRNQVLSQAAVNMLSQASEMPTMALSLLA